MGHAAFTFTFNEEFVGLPCGALDRGDGEVALMVVPVTAMVMARVIVTATVRRWRR